MTDTDINNMLTTIRAEASAQSNEGNMRMAELLVDIADNMGALRAELAAKQNGIATLELAIAMQAEQLAASQANVEKLRSIANAAIHSLPRDILIALGAITLNPDGTYKRTSLTTAPNQAGGG